MNFLIGIGIVIASIFGLAVQVVIGGALIAFGLVNMVNAYRRQIKLWSIYAFCWVTLYFGGHILIAYLDPVYFSNWTTVWTLFFPAVSALGLWVFGGFAVDMTLILSKLSDQEFHRLIHTLRVETADQRPPLTEPVRILVHYFKTTANYPTEMLIFMLELWRRLGKSVLQFLRFAFMVGALAGLYFHFFPPSNNWRMFGVAAVAFFCYCLAGIHFNWTMWRRVSIVAMAVATLAGQLTPYVSNLPTITMPRANLLNIGLACIALGLFGSYVGSFFKWLFPDASSSDKPSTSNPLVGEHHEH